VTENRRLAKQCSKHASSTIRRSHRLPSRSNEIGAINLIKRRRYLAQRIIARHTRTIGAVALRINHRHERISIKRDECQCLDDWPISVGFTLEDSYILPFYP